MRFLEYFLHRRPHVEFRPAFGISKRHAYWCENPHCENGVVPISPGEAACPECGGTHLTFIRALHDAEHARARQRLERQRLLKRGERNDLNTLTEMRAPDEVRKAR